MYYALVKPLGKTSDRYLCELPDREWLSVGQYLIYIGDHGEERVGIVAAPDFEADKDDIKSVWSCSPYRVVASLRRHEIEWPDDEMNEPLPEIDE